MEKEQYNKITKEDAIVLSIDGADEKEQIAFVDKWNELVDKLNSEIYRLNELQKEFGGNIGSLTGEARDRYEARYQTLYKEHCESYEKFRDMEEDLMLADAHSKGININNDEDDSLDDR